MPVEHVGQQPPRLLLSGPGRLLLPHSGQQLTAQLLHTFRPLIDLLGRLRFLGQRTRNLHATRDLRPSNPFKPVAEPKRRDAVVLVVALHDATHVRRDVSDAGLQATFHGAKSPARRLERHRARERVERLEILDGVTLDPGQQGLTHDAVEVDEVTATEESIDLGLARGMPAHQSPESGRLIGRVVIDMHPRMLPAPGLDEVDDAPKRLGLLGVSHGPPRLIPILAGRIDGDHAEEILAAAFDREGVAFEIEEHVTRVRLGQPQQALALDHGPKLMERRRQAARGELHFGLIPHAQQSLERPTLRLDPEVRTLREGGQGGEAALHQLAPL